MAIQTQRTDRLAAMWQTVAVAAGTLVVGAALAVGGLGALGTARVSSPVQPAVRNITFGVNAPAGADVATLPQGYRDYIRDEQLPAEVRVSAHTAAPHVLGIDLPVGAVLEQLPGGLKDYIRQTWPDLLPVTGTNPALGVDVPAGAQVSELPAGITDYLRDRTGAREQ